MIPIDITAILKEGLNEDKRAPDALLHASSDLVGSLRHSQLRFVGAPERERSIVDDIRLRTGTMWHSYIHDLLGRANVPFMDEVNVTPWMPKGWSGTADWLFYHPEYEAFVLGDLKTTKGEAIKWKTDKGMSVEHQWQASAYWYALVEAGFPMLDTFAIMYLPMNNVMREDDPEPTVIEAKPIEKDVLYGVMAERYAAAVEYSESLTYLDDDPRWDVLDMGLPVQAQASWYLTDALAPPLDRVQKLIWKTKEKHWDVTLVPHWLADFCPFAGTGLCDCSEQGATKIGHWFMDGKSGPHYKPRKDSKVDFTDLTPEVAPNFREIRRRLK